MEKTIKNNLWKYHLLGDKSYHLTQPSNINIERMLDDTFDLVILFKHRPYNIMDALDMYSVVSLSLTLGISEFNTVLHDVKQIEFSPA